MTLSRLQVGRQAWLLVILGVWLGRAWVGREIVGLGGSNCAFCSCLDLSQLQVLLKMSPQTLFPTEGPNLSAPTDSLTLKDRSLVFPKHLVFTLPRVTAKQGLGTEMLVSAFARDLRVLSGDGKLNLA